MICGCVMGVDGYNWVVAGILLLLREVVKENAPKDDTEANTRIRNTHAKKTTSLTNKGRKHV